MLDDELDPSLFEVVVDGEPISNVPRGTARPVDVGLMKRYCLDRHPAGDRLELELEMHILEHARVEQLETTVEAVRHCGLGIECLLARLCHQGDVESVGLSAQLSLFSETMPKTQ